MIDHEAIRAECNRIFPRLPCAWPRCDCLAIPVKHMRQDAEAKDKLRDEIANSGDC